MASISYVAMCVTLAIMGTMVAIDSNMNRSWLCVVQLWSESYTYVVDSANMILIAKWYEFTITGKYRLAQLVHYFSYLSLSPLAYFLM